MAMIIRILLQHDPLFAEFGHHVRAGSNGRLGQAAITVSRFGDKGFAQNAAGGSGQQVNISREGLLQLDLNLCIIEDADSFRPVCFTAHHRVRA